MTSVFSFYRLFEKALSRLTAGAFSSADAKGVYSGYRAHRIETRVPFPIRIPDIVLSAEGLDQFYFRDRRNRYEVGAIGCTRVFTGNPDGKLPIDEIAGLWEQDPLFVLFGGMSFFNNSATPPEWRSFDRFRFVLPLVEFRGDADGCTIVLNCLFPENQEPFVITDDIGKQLRALDDMALSQVPSGEIPPHSETLVPGHEKWGSLVKEALGWLRENGARKVVLARKKIMKSDQYWDPVRLFRGIERIEEDSFLFYCRQKTGDAFFGRSPERLFNLSEGVLSTDAIAGTRPRGDNPGQDDLLESQLMASIKDLEEHRIVVDYIREHMARLCKTLEVTASLKPLKLRHLQHIITRVRGRDHNGLNPVETMFRLHPTPAVCGVPPEGSKEMIQRLEPFGRGWYGAPIGWMSRHAAEFAVGIRSALVSEKELHLFGGAGIVEKSDAEMEWQETGHKMENFTRILDGEI